MNITRKTKQEASSVMLPVLLQCSISNSTTVRNPVYPASSEEHAGRQTKRICGPEAGLVRYMGYRNDSIISADALLQAGSGMTVVCKYLQG